MRALQLVKQVKNVDDAQIEKALDLMDLAVEDVCAWLDGNPSLVADALEDFSPGSADKTRTTILRWVTAYDKWKVILGPALNQALAMKRAEKMQ